MWIESERTQNKTTKWQCKCSPCFYFWDWCRNASDRGCNERPQGQQHMHAWPLHKDIIDFVHTRKGLSSSQSVNFTNILRAAFTHTVPKSAKKTVNSSSFLRFWNLRRKSCEWACWWNWTRPEQSRKTAEMKDKAELDVAATQVLLLTRKQHWVLHKAFLSGFLLVPISLSNRSVRMPERLRRDTLSPCFKKKKGNFWRNRFFKVWHVRQEWSLFYVLFCVSRKG